MNSVPPKKPAHRRDRRELEVLHRVAVALSQSLAFSDVMDALARELVHAVDRVSECTINIWHPARDILEVASVYVRGEGASEDDRGDIYLLDDYPASRVLLRAADGFGVQRMTDPGISAFILERLVEWGWRTWIELPLVVDGRSVGLIEMADYRSARRWAQRDIDFCRTIAAQAALAVRNAQLYEDLRTRVDKDPLTGVLNHRAFYERLEQELERARRGGTQVAVIVVDLDALADRLLAAVHEGIGLHASVGIAVADAPGETSARIVARADGSLLEAKAAGKRTYRVAA